MNTVVFFSSARNIVPPWGGESRLGDRVLKYVLTTLSKRGEGSIHQKITVYDPLIVFGEEGALAHSGAEMKAPTFFQSDDDLSEATKAMRETIKSADSIIVVSAEYNHSIPPALSSMMGHFGGSCYSCKPSAIVTYSVAPLGGSRAQIALQPMLHELGCLPVSKMVAIPTASETLKEDGTFTDPENRLSSQLPGMLDQLEWMANAMKNHRDANGTF